MIYLIITTCINNKYGLKNDEIRKNNYINSISRTLSVLPPTISPIIVENSNISSSYLDDFNIPVVYTNNNQLKYCHKGVNELKDIKEVIRRFNIQDSDIIIKLTGRYYPFNDSFFKLVEQNPEKDAFVSFYNVCRLEYMKYDCVLGMYALRCKYLNQFTYSNPNYSAEVDFARFIRNNIDENKLMSVEKLSMRCCFADDFRILDV